MEIKTILNKVGSYEKSKIEKPAPGKTGRSDDAKPASGTDTVSVSGEGRLAALANQEAQAASGVRLDRVAGLKASVDAGTYQPDNQAIAEKLVSDDLALLGE